MDALERRYICYLSINGLTTSDVDLGPWIRIQRYRIKGKAEFNRQNFGVFFLRKLSFFKSEPKKVANL